MEGTTAYASKRPSTVRKVRKGVPGGSRPAQVFSLASFVILWGLNITLHLTTVDETHLEPPASLGMSQG